MFREDENLTRMVESVAVFLVRCEGPLSTEETQTGTAPESLAVTRLITHECIETHRRIVLVQVEEIEAILESPLRYMCCSARAASTEKHRMFMLIRI